MTAAVFVILFGAALVLGFFGVRMKGASMKDLASWSLAGRSFGNIVSWFLVGGDLYTGYTFIAIPALIYTTGALGFYALPYCILIYPLLYVVFPKIWRVAHKHNYVTGPQYVRGRFGNRYLALAIGLTGILATMPYIALQLVSTQVVFGALGWSGEGLLKWVPLAISFLVLAGFSFQSGLRGSALIAIFKGVLVYASALGALIIIPLKLGGFSAIFAKVAAAKVILTAPSAHSLSQFSAYATLAVGSAIALYLYPHAITGQMSVASVKVIRRNAVTLHAFNILLAALAMLGFMAAAAGVASNPAFANGFKAFGSSFAIPALYMQTLPDWFVGLSFAGIAVACLVPAAIMAIGSANIIVRDIWTVFASWSDDATETQWAKYFAVLMVVGGLVFAIGIPMTEIVMFQLLGGIWICQTAPSVFLSLFPALRRKLNSYGLITGWAVGMIVGTTMVVMTHFVSLFNLPWFGGFTIPAYIAIAALLPNAIVAFIVSPLVAHLDNGIDETAESDYADQPVAVAAPSTLPAGLRPAH